MPATVPKAQMGVITPSKQGALPLLPDGEAIFIKRELARLQNMIDEMIIMTPQSATAEPKKLRDGMKRLSRNPWWPVVAQTRDEWVFYDAAGRVWRYFVTQPTTT